MSYVDDEMIAAEDGPDLGPPRTREEWEQLFASLEAAERMTTLARMPAWSSDVEEFVATGYAIKSRFEGDVRVVERFDLTSVSPTFDPRRRAFNASRDLPVALSQADAAFNFEWGSLRVGDPIVIAAIREAARAENLKHGYGAEYRCDACLSAGDLSTFTWAGALFIHLLSCKKFKSFEYDAGPLDDEPDPRDDRREEDEGNWPDR